MHNTYIFYAIVITFIGFFSSLEIAAKKVEVGVTYKLYDINNTFLGTWLALLEADDLDTFGDVAQKIQGHIAENIPKKYPKPYQVKNIVMMTYNPQVLTQVDAILDIPITGFVTAGMLIDFWVEAKELG